MEDFLETALPWPLLNRNVSLPNVTPVLILRRYMLFGLIPAEMEVGDKLFQILQAEFEPAYRGAAWGPVYSACQFPLTITSVPFSHLRTAWYT